MNSSTKILIGAGLTALLAWGSHSVFDKGAAFVDGLEAQAKETLAAQSVEGVTVASERDPALKRVIILSGDKSDEEKAKIIAAVKEPLLLPQQLKRPPPRNRLPNARATSTR